MLMLRHDFIIKMKMFPRKRSQVQSKSVYPDYFNLRSLLSNSVHLPKVSLLVNAPSIYLPMVETWNCLNSFLLCLVYQTLGLFSFLICLDLICFPCRNYGFIFFMCVIAVCCLILVSLPLPSSVLLEELFFCLK